MSIKCVIMNKNDNQMHPDDIRNMIIFVLLSLVLYFSYSQLVLKPQQEAKLARQAQIEEIKQQAELNPSEDEQLSKLSRPEILAKAERIQIKTPELSGSISLTGARIDDMALNNYFKTLEKKEPVTVLSPRGSALPRTISQGWVSNDKIGLPDDKTRWSKLSGDVLTPNTPIRIGWTNAQNIRFERTYDIDENYLITITQKVINNSGKDITLYPYAAASQTGVPKDLQGSYILHEGPIGYIGEELVELSYKDLMKAEKKETFQSEKGWIGITEKYWLTTIMPPQNMQAKYRYSYVPNAADTTRAKYQVDYTGAAQVIASGTSAQTTSHAFVGAKKVTILEDYETQLGLPHFDLAVDFGMFYFMTKPFFHFLHWIGQHVGNFGIAIIIFTIVMRSLVFPLTNLSYKSFAKMKKVSPQIMELRKKHGDDKAALQKDIMELYQREGVNPMAGCLPIIIQIPIFFSLYKVLFTSIEMRHAPFYGWIDDLSAADPTTIFNLFGLLPYDVPSILHFGAWPCMMLLVMLAQKQLNPPPQDKIQRDMMRVFPFFITFIMSKFAAGLVIYWTFSALISVLQQIVIMKRLGVPVHLLGESKDEEELDKALDEGGPSVHPLAEMAEDDLEDALFGEEETPKEITPPKKKKSKKKKK